MHLLLVAATAGELQPLTARFSTPRTISAHLTRFTHPRHQIDVLVTGVGMVATAVWCARVFEAARPEVAVNVGICGTFNPELALGSVVHVVSDCLPELGAENGDQFLTLEDLALFDKDETPFHDGRLVNASPPASPVLAELPQVRGITVNTVHGQEASIARVVERWEPDVESMEGAAFMYAALTAGVRFAQIRGISNRIERRNRESWKILEATTKVNDAVGSLIETL